MRFDKEAHAYWSDDGRRLISVTQLLRKHGLAPDYSGVPEGVLKAKAERGTMIHKEIEDYVKRGEAGISAELLAFIAATEKLGCRPIASEETVGNDIAAGTFDLLLDYGDRDFAIADVKTTYALHKESVAWQLSLYAYLSGNPRIKRGEAWHFGPKGLHILGIPLKPKEEVERLLECERNGEIYEPKAGIIPESQLALMAQAQAIIEEAEERKKRAEKDLESVKEAIMEAMMENGMTKYEDSRIRITLVGPTERVTIDSKALKSEFPEVYEAVRKTSRAKASLRIALKGENE